MRVLITGGAGFIGQRTGQLLLKQAHQVTILDNLSPPAHDGPPALPAGMELVEGDIRKREDWVKALKENEVVLHLADHHDYLPSFSKLFHINAVVTAIPPRCSKMATSCGISSTSRMWRAPTWQPSTDSRPAPTTWPVAEPTR